MAANRNSRYYSQSYEPVDNPGHPEHLGHPETSHQPEASYAQGPEGPEGNYQDYETYRGFKTVSDLEISEPNAGLPPREPKGTNKKKWFIIGGVAAACVIIGLAVGLGVGLTQGKDTSYDYTPANGAAYVTDSRPFTKGGATHADPTKTDDGNGAGTDEYTYYDGPASNFPNATTDWISFEDLWAGNLHFFKTSCHANKFGKDQTDEEIQSIYDAIQNRAKVSLVDHRFILATVLQETHGCAKVKITTSSGGVSNPGLMQSHGGTQYNSHHANESIWDMVQDGTQGTATGDGLVQNLIYYGNAYTAARGYNSGIQPLSGNLSEAEGATACYVSDLANRLTGWSNATSKCWED